MNIYLEKIAKKDSPSRLTEIDPEYKGVGLGAGAAYGAALAEKQYRSGALTGRKSLYHGTSAEMADKIIKEGLKPQSVTGSTSGATAKVGSKLLKLNEGKVFLGKNRRTALDYSLQQGMKGKPPGMVRVDMPVGKRSTPYGTVRKKPFKSAVNPELKGLKKRMAESIIPVDPVTQHYIERSLGPKNTYVNQGAIPSSYIKGSSNYRGLGKEEFKDYLKSNKSKAAKGYTKALAGTALVTASGKGLLDMYRDGRKNMSKKASEEVVMNKYIEKAAAKTLDQIDDDRSTSRRRTNYLPAVGGVLAPAGVAAYYAAQPTGRKVIKNATGTLKTERVFDVIRKNKALPKPLPKNLGPHMLIAAGVGGMAGNKLKNVIKDVKEEKFRAERVARRKELKAQRTNKYIEKIAANKYVVHRVGKDAPEKTVKRIKEELKAKLGKRPDPLATRKGNSTAALKAKISIHSTKGLGSHVRKQGTMPR